MMGNVHLVMDINALLITGLLAWGCYRINMIAAVRRPGLEQLLAENAILLLAHILQTGALMEDAFPGKTILVAFFQFISVAAYYSIHYSYYRYAVNRIRQTRKVPGWLDLHVILVVSGLALMECVAYVNGWFYTLTADGRIIGPHYLLGSILAWYPVVLVALVLVFYRKALGHFELFKLLSFLLVPALHAMTRNFGLGHYMTMPASLTISCLFLFTFYYLERSMQLRSQLQRSAEDRLRIAISQIQPHFVYNELNTIYVLCERDPELAQKSIGLFSDYLRSNLDGMQNVGLITLDQELNHVKTYLELEKIRFRDRLQVVWQLEPVSCMLPPLTVQPIVENAVKHGVTKRRLGGTVTISVHRSGAGDDERTEICIEDDGVGFDWEEVSQDGGVHIGINNVRDRIEMMCGGTLQINSEKGKGTRAVISIPRRVPEGVRLLEADR